MVMFAWKRKSEGDVQGEETEGWHISYSAETDG